MSLVLSVLVVAVVLGLLYRHGHAGRVFTEPVLLALDVALFFCVCCVVASVVLSSELCCVGFVLCFGN